MFTAFALTALLATLGSIVDARIVWASWNR
jgi:hypothetical protein